MRAVALAVALAAAGPAAADVLIAGSGSCGWPGAVPAGTTAMAVTLGAPDGPMPDTRAAVAAAAAAGVPVAWILIEDVALVDDGELLLMIDAEMREIVTGAGAVGPVRVAMGDAVGPVLNAVLVWGRAVPDGAPCLRDLGAFKDLIVVGR